MLQSLNNVLIFLNIIVNILMVNASIGKKINLYNSSSNEEMFMLSDVDINYHESSYKDEDELLKHLFKDYNPNIIPRRSSNESLKLYIGLAMIQLINMYEKEQVMKTNVWMHMWWNDFQLKWSHIERYNHIYSIRVPFNMVWTPDIVLFNNAYGDYEVSYKTNVVLYQQGGILWIPPAIYKSTCEIEVKYFPYDEQMCEMRFGSWIYNANELTLDYFEGMKSVDLNEYVPSGTWDVLSVPAHIEFSNHSNSGRELKKAQMVYKIKIRRKTLFYTINLIIPTFLISCLSICVFYLPCDETGSGEKITLSLSIIFALLVYFLLLTKQLPPTSVVVPLISKYLLFIFVMNMLSVFNTCIVISCYYKQPNINLIHPWIRLLFIEILPKALFMKRPVNHNRNKMFHNQEINLESINNNEPNNLNEKFRKLSIRFNSYNHFYTRIIKDNHNVSFFPSFNSYNKQKIKLQERKNDSMLKKSSLYEINKLKSNLQEKNFCPSISQDFKIKNEYTKDIIEATKSIKYISYLTTHRRNIEIIRDDYRFMSAVIDRLMLIVFFLVITSGTTYLLFSTPHVFERIDQQNVIKSYLKQ